MKQLEERYLERLSQLYPTIAKASTEIINLQAEEWLWFSAP